jgi:uncharacterized RDD family membrane protein YckC
MTATGAPVQPAEVRHLVTPEGVDLRLRIGTAGERASGFLLDAVFLITALIVFSLCAAFAVGALNSAAPGDAKDGLNSLMAVIWFLGFFFLRNGYFIIFELTARAATPGKRIMGLRVAARDGGRLTAEAVVARNALREIEFFLPLQLLMASMLGMTDPVAGWIVLMGLLWTGGFVLFPLFNRDRLRVGDFVAGTWVVKATRQRLGIDLLDANAMAPAQGFDFSPDQASAYGIKELHVLEDVLRRRDRKTMSAVADRIRAKIGWRPRGDETDAAFLAAYYAALRGRLETQLLFGKRRKDKFDTR